MRHEWSLECRRAGLDHLAESFKKPSVLNPRDDDVLPFTDPSLHRNPIEAVVASVVREDLTSNLDAKLAFLNGEGVAGVAHTGNGKFDAHLVGVASVLRAWGCDDSVVDAGLFSLNLRHRGLSGLQPAVRTQGRRPRAHRRPGRTFGAHFLRRGPSLGG